MLPPPTKYRVSAGFLQSNLRLKDLHKIKLIPYYDLFKMAKNPVQPILQNAIR